MPVSSYTVSFNNSTPGVMLSSVIVSPCMDNVCKYQLAASTYCQSTGPGSISVAVSAKNELGAGLSSDPVYVGKSLLHVLCYKGEGRGIHDLIQLHIQTDSELSIMIFRNPPAYCCSFISCECSCSLMY